MITIDFFSLISYIFKMNKYILFLIYALFSANLIESQELYFKEKPLMFFHEKSQQVILIQNDSIVIKIKDNVKIPLKHSSYPSSLSEYIPFNIKKRNYFVHRGCGVVLEYRNDSIVRIDKSFLHQNQFDAATFVYKDEIYFYGGYGLFTTKNILTKYDFKLNEWSLVRANNNLSPHLTDVYFHFVDNKLFVFGGHNSNNSVSFDLNNNYVYCLDLNKMLWSRYKTNFLENAQIDIYEKNKFYFEEVLVINKLNRLISIDFLKNKMTYYNYSIPYPIMINSFVKNDTLNALLTPENYIKHNHYVFKSFSIKEILKNPFKEQPFYYEEQPYYLYGLAFFILPGLFFFAYNKRSFITYYISPSFPFQYLVSSQVLYFKGKKVKHLSEDDIKILNKIASHPNQFISLNEFNEMFTIDYETENYAAIVKRREKKLEVFLKLLANVSSYDIKDLIHERKNEVDKRIKEVLFLPNKIKFIKK